MDPTHVHLCYYYTHLTASFLKETTLCILSAQLSACSSSQRKFELYCRSGRKCRRRTASIVDVWTITSTSAWWMNRGDRVRASTRTSTKNETAIANSQRRRRWNSAATRCCRRRCRRRGRTTTENGGSTSTLSTSTELRTTYVNTVNRFIRGKGKCERSIHRVS